MRKDNTENELDLPITIIAFDDAPEPQSVNQTYDEPYSNDFEDFDRVPVKAGRVNGHSWRSVGNITHIGFKAGVQL